MVARKGYQRNALCPFMTGEGVLQRNCGIAAAESRVKVSKRKHVTEMCSVLSWPATRCLVQAMPGFWTAKVLASLDVHNFAPGFHSASSQAHRRNSTVRGNQHSRLHSNPKLAVHRSPAQPHRRNSTVRCRPRCSAQRLARSMIGSRISRPSMLCPGIAWLRCDAN